MRSSCGAAWLIAAVIVLYFCVLSESRDSPDSRSRCFDTPPIRPRETLARLVSLTFPPLAERCGGARAAGDANAHRLRPPPFSGPRPPETESRPCWNRDSDSQKPCWICYVAPGWNNVALEAAMEVNLPPDVVQSFQGRKVQVTVHGKPTLKTQNFRICDFEDTFEVDPVRESSATIRRRMSARVISPGPIPPHFSAFYKLEINWTVKVGDETDTVCSRLLVHVIPPAAYNRLSHCLANDTAGVLEDELANLGFFLAYLNIRISAQMGTQAIYELLVDRIQRCPYLVYATGKNTCYFRRENSGEVAFDYFNWQEFLRAYRRAASCAAGATWWARFFSNACKYTVSANCEVYACIFIFLCWVLGLNIEDLMVLKLKKNQNANNPVPDEQPPGCFRRRLARTIPNSKEILLANNLELAGHRVCRRMYPRAALPTNIRSFTYHVLVADRSDGFACIDCSCRLPNKILCCISLFEDPHTLEQEVEANDTYSGQVFKKGQYVKCTRLDKPEIHGHVIRLVRPPEDN